MTAADDGSTTGTDQQRSRDDFIRRYYLQFTSTLFNDNVYICLEERQLLLATGPAPYSAAPTETFDDGDNVLALLSALEVSQNNDCNDNSLWHQLQEFKNHHLGTETYVHLVIIVFLLLKGYLRRVRANLRHKCTVRKAIGKYSQNFIFYSVGLCRPLGYSSVCRL